MPFPGGGIHLHRRPSYIHPENFRGPCRLPCGPGNKPGRGVTAVDIIDQLRLQHFQHHHRNQVMVYDQVRCLRQKHAYPAQSCFIRFTRDSSCQRYLDSFLDGQTARLERSSMLQKNPADTSSRTSSLTSDRTRLPPPMRCRLQHTLSDDDSSLAVS